MNHGHFTLARISNLIDEECKLVDTPFCLLLPVDGFPSSVGVVGWAMHTLFIIQATVLTANLW
jgi:hypothetical protein